MSTGGGLDHTIAAPLPYDHTTANYPGLACPCWHAPDSSQQDDSLCRCLSDPQQRVDARLIRTGLCASALRVHAPVLLVSL